MAYQKDAGTPQSVSVCEAERNHIKEHCVSIFRMSKNFIQEHGKYTDPYKKHNNRIFIGQDKLRNTTSNLFDFAVKSGSEIFNSEDPFNTAVEVVGKKMIGNSLSKMLTSQCSGVIGLAVSSVSPNVLELKMSVPNH